ncbi:glycosyl hydrolase family 17 protein [Saccharicrinis sp. GN24d3]|uniref:glycosyl hydrolase family 17 protein n=1 Tax=Saccharicrinis sp. GN24d3 TaxID=3458416 RepID=UPI0040370B07
MKSLWKITLILFVLAGCQSPKQKKVSSVELENEIEMIQPKSALLSGLSAAICYSGFRSGQHPDRGNGAVNPSYDEILEDLHILSKNNMYQLIRLYDSGVNTQMVLKVIKENKIDIKVLLGIWLDAELSAHETCEWLSEPIPQDELDQNKKKNLTEIANGIKLANAYPEIICAVNVGNECLVDWNDHKVSPDTIISYVNHVKSQISQPVTVADNYKWWADHGTELANVVDFVSIHVYPVWEGKDMDEGIVYTVANVKEVQSALPGSKIVITEAGWASVASEFGERASEEKQKQYYNWIMEWSKENNITTFFFEAFDEDWKGNPDNSLGAEKHWGIFTVDRKPKKVMKGIYPEL